MVGEGTYVCDCPGGLEEVTTRFLYGHLPPQSHCSGNTNMSHSGGVVVVVRGQQQGAREKPRLPLHPEEIAADPGTVLSSRSWPGEQKTAGFIFEGRWRDALVL